MLVNWMHRRHRHSHLINLVEFVFVLHEYHSQSIILDCAWVIFAKRKCFDIGIRWHSVYCCIYVQHCVWASSNTWPTVFRIHNVCLDVYICYKYLNIYVAISRCESNWPFWLVCVCCVCEYVHPVMFMNILIRHLRWSPTNKTKSTARNRSFVYTKIGKKQLRWQWLDGRKRTR